VALPELHAIVRPIAAQACRRDATDEPIAFADCTSEVRVRFSPGFIRTLEKRTHVRFAVQLP